MSLQTAHDISVLISIPGDSPTAAPSLLSERRISPSWTISQLKAKLEPVTGIPPSSQVLKTRGATGEWLTLSDNDLVGDGRFRLRTGSELEITDTRPAAARTNFTDVSSVEKYQMPETQYEQLDDSVLAWKRRQKLGRFDPNARSAEEMAQQRRMKDRAEVEEKGIEKGDRCRVGGDDGKRGTVRFVGEIEGLGGNKEAGCWWIGVELDEPVGRNGGSVNVVRNGGKEETKKVFECKDKFGVFARPEKVEPGAWPPLDDLEIDEEMEEI